MTAPALSKLLRHEPKFSAAWVTSGMSATSFTRVVFHKSEVIESMADNEDSYQYEVLSVRE